MRDRVDGCLVGFVMILIIVNTIMLAIENPYLPTEVENVLKILNYILFALFAGEMVCWA